METKSFGVYRAEWEDGGEDVRFYKEGRLIYSLAKNTYRTKFVLLEWFKLQDKTVHIFNPEHAEIAVIDADTGEVLRRSYTFGMFICSYELLDDRQYLHLSGWIWQPFPSREIFHIPTLLTQDNVKGIDVPVFDCRNLDPGVDLFGFSTCAEFLANKDKFFADKHAREAACKFNENGKRCFLWTILHKKPDDNAIIIIDETLRSQILSLFENKLDMLFVDSIGNISGDNLYKDWALYTLPPNLINQENLATYVLQIIGAPGFIKPVTIDTVNFRYEVKAISQNSTLENSVLQFTIHISRKYQPVTSDTFEPVSSFPLKIEFRLF